MNPSFEQTLIEVWRQAIVEDAEVVELGKEVNRGWLHDLCGRRRETHQNAVSRLGFISGSEDRGRRDPLGARVAQEEGIGDNPLLRAHGPQSVRSASGLFDP
jgi:hypothetical protein